MMKRIFDNTKKIEREKEHLPQNGIPSGIQFPLSHTRRDGPSSSKPRSHEYDATVPFCSDSSENIMLLCAGEPGKLHD